MSDERLRQLERRWRESGSITDEARHLLERVRIGQLSPRTLELAAYLGHEAAVLAWGKAPERPGSVWEWVRDLSRWERSASVRAAFAVTESTAPEAWAAFAPGDRRIAAALDAIASGILGRGETARAAVARCRLRVLACRDEAAHAGESARRAADRRAAGAALGACRGVLLLIEAVRDPAGAAEAAARAAGDRSLWPAHSGYMSVTDRVRVVRSAVAPWVLNYGDRVAARLEERVTSD